jgi:ArsR family transcriptional regulator
MAWHDGRMARQLLEITPVPSATECCAPLTTAPLTVDEAKDLAGLLKAIADPTRLRLLSLMLANEDFEACTCDLIDALAVSQPTVSHHLKKLAEAGLVRADRRKGSWTFYRVVPESLESLAAVIAPAGVRG